ncbi:MAG: ABC transporter ATP-binding protein [Proteiniphilum sp.]|uniref:ABC transporter ATP-binding protein n=1 Tax=Proteiniphilum sp. TaxID=1926877 RepID=UPI002B1E9DCD|nr:ABC transporter ATP-binding protein [Proteiniphilum sp.]MEA5129699.1 ABC transporter ATP-binding protein [Proteiniphilum sp.]
MQKVIHVQNLTKQFGSFKALDSFDITVNKGEVHGFLGPNGSGKTTTIKILLGLIRKTSGEVSLLGGNPWKDVVELHKRLAYVPGDVNLWPDLTGGEVIDFLGRLRGNFNTNRRDELIEKFHLDPSKKCKTYSTGNRQKVALISAFSSDVELIILDEPTSGLDPLMSSLFRECVRETNQNGITILFSSHILTEVEELCNRVTIIKDGKTIDSGSLEDMRHFSLMNIVAETQNPVSGLDTLRGIHNLDISGNNVTFQAEAGALQEAVTLLTRYGIKSLQSHPPTLKDLFMRYYK